MCVMLVSVSTLNTMPSCGCRCRCELSGPGSLSLSLSLVSSVTLGHLVQPDLTMAVLTSHLVILTASLGLASSQTCSGVGYFPHPSDCSQFFRCTDIWATGQYQQYAFTCAEGTVFDASIRKSFSYLQLIFSLKS